MEASRVLYSPSVCETIQASAPSVRPVRLGAHLCTDGADFALRAPAASAVTLCLFDEDSEGNITERRYALTRSTQYWEGHIPGVHAGQRYGYRIHGTWNPATGQVANPAKLLLDPYARGISGHPTLHPALFSHRVDDNLQPTQDFTRDDTDSAPYMCYGIVLDNETRPIKHPYIPRHDTVIYETHVKGMTALHPDVPHDERGTYKGMGHPSVVNYIRDLGVTTVELLPIHAKMDEIFLAQRSLTNYWGYNTLSYFSPEPSYATRTAQEAGAQAVIDEVKAMVDAYHEAGLEIILDVVYNHTCEGGMDGPTLSWRGIDQSTYYMSDQHDPGRFLDTTGCGNSLDFRRQTVIQMVLDSLRYWVNDIGVDGFRFDLAATLGRNGESFDSHHPFYMALVTDPILGNVKLINEPWDVGTGGWQTGNFPGPTCDWNDHFRDSVRDFWLGSARCFSEGNTPSDMRDFATRLAGSADLFGRGRAPGGRGPGASINFVTAHDGFTLADVVAYNNKHNEANKEDNRDGTSTNRSWNHGVEGEAGNTVNTERRRSMRNLLGTLFFASGTPMLLAGDECGRSQKGNNNSYCQDNELSWTNWHTEDWQDDLRESVRHMIALRASHRVLRPQNFYTHEILEGDCIPSVSWRDATGEALPDYRWFDPYYPVLQMLRSGFSCDSKDALLVFNRSLHAQQIVLPAGRGKPFELVFDSTWERPQPHNEFYMPQARTLLSPSSMRLFLA